MFKITGNTVDGNVRTYTYEINGGTYTLDGDADDPSFDDAYVHLWATGGVFPEEAPDPASAA